MDIILKVGLVIILILLNGFFVASEFSLVSIRKTRVEELAKKGNRRAQTLLAALENLNLFISATQLGITIASLALGWIGEPAVAHFIEPDLGFLPHFLMVITAHTLAVVIAFSLITYFHIIIGELVPKSMAIQRSESAALILITPLIIFAKIFTPFIWLLNKSGQFVLRSFGFKSTSEKQTIHSEEEVKMILSESSQSGAIPQDDVEMVYNVFQFGDTFVKDVMVPRSSILAFNINSTLKEVADKIETNPHSRFPIFEESIDRIIGFIHVKDIYRELLKNGDRTPLESIRIIRKIINVSENEKLDDVLEEMQFKRVHVAVVTSSEHKTAGIITLEDVIESLVGEIEDEFN